MIGYHLATFRHHILRAMIILFFLPLIFIMNTIKRIRLPDGGFFYVEVQPEEDGLPTLPEQSDLPSGAEPTGFNDVIVETVDAVQGSIAHAVQFIVNEFAENQPAALEVELSIAFKGKAAIPVILTGESNMGLKIKAIWKKDA